MLRAQLTTEEILNGGIPDWQMLMWCQYGKCIVLKQIQ